MGFFSRPRRTLPERGCRSSHLQIYSAASGTNAASISRTARV